MAKNQPSSQIVLTIECQNLSSFDALSASDPFVVVEEDGKEIARTERLKNQPNPKFEKRAQLNYFFERSQRMTFHVYDSDDSTSSKISKHDLIGEVTVSLSEIVSRKKWSGTLLHPDHKSPKGLIHITAEEVTGKPSDIIIRLVARHVDKKDLFGKSDPYLKLYKVVNGVKSIIHTTNTLMNTLDPDWEKFTLDSFIACGNDFNTEIVGECFDYDSNSDHDLIGVFHTTFEEMKTKKSFNLINNKKVSKKGYVNSGEVLVHEFHIENKYSFLDYVSAGCEISLMVAIDFTGSNGDPNSSDSLHYRNPHALNEYQQAILAVGSVVEPYDSDHLFPVFGFGAKLKDGKVYHDFNCNLNPADANVLGVQGILNAYTSSLNYVELWGPTNFAPIIQKVSGIVSSIPKEAQKYFILLILTDGEITDMSDTVDAIVRATDLPMSIIIVGVGSADFSAMETLDGDKNKLSSRSGVAKRDIVQFVPFRKQGRSPQNLAEEVLYEVPAQLLSYMRLKGLKPLRI